MLSIVAGALVFAIGVTPVLGFVPFDFQVISTVADHYLYLSMFGVALVIAAAINAWRWSYAVAITIAALLISAILSTTQTRHWKDTKSLFKQALAVNACSAVAHNSLASYYVMTGEFAPAAAHAAKAVELAPRQPQGYVTLGSVYARQRDFALAEQQYRTALELAPDDSMVLGNLIGLLAEQGNMDEAIPLARRAIEIDPGNATARLNLGTMLARQGRWSDAAVELESAVRLDPRDVQARNNLGIALMNLGQFDRAAEQYRAALSIHPNFAPAQRGLADIQNALRSQTPPATTRIVP
jgi:Flp pilus assembly protein TadD